MRISVVAILLTLFVGVSCQNSNSKKPDSPDAPETPDYPNIILLVGDDQGYPYFGFMGADYVQTPNMDKLASRGTLFTQGYVPDNHCRPSLQTLMTGMLPIEYERVANYHINKQGELAGIDSLDEAGQAQWKRQYSFQTMKHFKTLPTHLKEKGYVSFQGGKWWEFNYQNGGFDEGMTTGWDPEDEGKADWFQKFMGGEGTELARATMQPVYDFIDQQGDQPMFIWFAPELPHYPFDAPDKYYQLYADQDMTESAKRYYANCTWFDDGLGALTQYLEEKGELENTLFVYVNDNGWEQEPHQEFRHDSLRWHNGGDKGKLSLYDQSFRTPIIFSWPGHIPEGARSEALIQSADIPATILDYLDIKTPIDWHGRSYRPVIEQQETKIRNTIVGSVNKVRWEGDMMGRDIEGYWVRNKDWFFAFDKTNNEQRLYNMHTDPRNDTNVVADHPDLVTNFMQDISGWRTAKTN